jgi:hypothetical protein
MPLFRTYELIYMLARIQEKHPWFWELKALISERPNMVLVGVGNNSTPINVSLLQKPDTTGFGDSDMSHFRESSKDFDTQSEPLTDGFLGPSEGDDGDEEAGNADAEGDIDDEGGSEDGGDGDDMHLVGKKRKGKEKAQGQKKHAKVDEKKSTAPRPGKSTPAPTQKKTSKSAIDKFSEIAAKEEETTQKAIELKKTKLKASADREIAKVKSKAEIKMNQDRLHAELEMKKMEYEYRLKFAATQPGGAPPQPFPSFPKIPDVSNENYSHMFGGQSTNSSVSNSFSSGGHWNDAVASSSSASQRSEPTFTEQLQDNSTDFNFSELNY